MSLHARIAAALGWTEAEAKGFALITLRDFVRPVSPKLYAELTRIVRSGEAILWR